MYVTDCCHVEDVPPVPPFEVQELTVNRYWIGGVESLEEETVIAIVEVPVSLGAEEKVGGLGVGAEESEATGS